MNANPNDLYTPYMDFVERTGPDVYDLELRTRIGDLSGLSSGYLYGDDEPGFGIYTQNGYFSGAITAQTGSFTGIVWINTSATENMALGKNVSGTDDGFNINSNNYWYTDGSFKVGSSAYYLTNDSSGNITMKPQSLELDAGTGDLQISSTQKSMSLADGNLVMSGSGIGMFKIGSVKSVEDTSNRGFYIDGSGNFMIASSSKGYIQSSTSGLTIKSEKFDNYLKI